MLHFLRFLISKVFIINLLIALLLLAVGIYAILSYLEDFTLHGKTLEVPSLVNVHVSEVDVVLNESTNFSAFVSDSIYVKGKKAGVVVEQNPVAQTTVKQGRKIYLTVTTSQPPQVRIPNVVDMSLRQATSLLETFGLEIGTLTYKADLCKNCILKVLVDGEEVVEGQKINKGNSIDLVVGRGLGNELTKIPYLLNLTADMAENVLTVNSLNIGGERYDESVSTLQDSMKAKIYRQIPSYSEFPTIKMGSAVDIYLTLDTNKVKHTVNPADSL